MQSKPPGVAEGNAPGQDISEVKKTGHKPKDAQNDTNLP